MFFEKEHSPFRKASQCFFEKKTESFFVRLKYTISVSCFYFMLCSFCYILDIIL